MFACLGWGGVGGVGGEWVRGWVLGRGLCGEMLFAVSLDFLCRWQVHVSVCCATRIPAHLRWTQWSVLLHLTDICFLTCMFLLQISQIQTCLCVVCGVCVGPGFVSTSPAFVSSNANHTAGPHGRLAQKTGIGPPFLGAGVVDTICAASP